MPANGPIAVMRFVDRLTKMTWKQASRTLFDPDGYAESANPFYVPSRFRETVAFGTVIGLTGIGLFTIIFVDMSSADVGGFFVYSCLAAWVFHGGWQARRYRLRRVLAVSKLRARMLAEERADGFE